MKMPDFIPFFFAKASSTNNKKNLKFWILGFLAFAWFTLRSGFNPKRLAYPCQRAAFPLAIAWIVAVLSLLSGISLISLLSKTGKKLLVVILVAGVFISASTKNQNGPLNTEELPVWQSNNPVSEIFLLKTFDERDASLASGDASVPDDYLYDPAIDELVNIVSTNGTNFYQSGSAQGIVSSNDIVIIKGNFQWEFTLSTNTDRIKGLIWRILQHPDGFSGEILVCDNDQGIRDWASCNNSNDTEQSIIDVVNTFKAKGYPVDLVEWDKIMSSTVNEYSSGDMNDGFTYNSTSKVSYPKFQSPGNKYISLKHGIYNTSSQEYDRDQLCIINFAVNKAHGYSGATLAIKNWVGAMSLTDKNGRYGSEDIMHLDYFLKEFALPARVMAETYPDLNIIDATWTAPNDNYTNSSGNRENTKVLLASTDPVASSWYAAKYILNPIAANDIRTDPDYVEPNPGSIGLYSYRYSMALEHWEDYLADIAGLNVTSNPEEISVYDRANAQSIPQIAKDDIRIQYIPDEQSVSLLKLDNTAPINSLDIRITSLDGKVVLSENLYVNTKIYLPEIPHGIYIVTYYINKELTLSKKIIL